MLICLSPGNGHMNTSGLVYPIDSWWRTDNFNILYRNKRKWDKWCSMLAHPRATKLQLLRTIVYYYVLLCTTAYYCELLRTIVYYCILLCTIVYYCVLLCTTAYYCVLLCTIV